MQRIAIFQQNGRAEPKIRWLRSRARDLEIVAVFDLDGPHPEVIDDPQALLPASIDADLVLSYLSHPDLADGLAERCRDLGITLVSSGRRLAVPGVHNPPTCCGLARAESLGPYGRQFGAPEITVRMEAGRVAAVEVQRGSPCGATWRAAERIIGLTPDEAEARFGLEIQMHCQADPAGWDPIHGQSPVHFSGKIHAAAFRRALAAAAGDG